MTAVAPVRTERSDALSYGVVGLLTVVIFINYVDRGSLATAVPLIKTDLRLSNTEVGLLISAFFWTYTPGQILAAWLADKINAYRTLAAGLVVWSLATAATGLATGFVSLLILRLLLGLGESAPYPCSSKLFAQHLPSHRLGGVNGLMAAGQAVGPAFGTLAGGLMMARLGWRPVFIVFGLASMLWLWPWLRLTRGASSSDEVGAGGARPTNGEILRRRDFWGAGLGHFCCAYVFYFVVSWLPLYLVKAHGFTVSRMAEVGGLVYLAYAMSAAAVGWLCDRLISAGWSARVVRKASPVVGLLACAAGMSACALGDARASVAGLFVAAIGFGLNTMAMFANGQTLAGPDAAGKWIGLQNCIGNFAGIVGPIVTGLIVDRTGEYQWAFVLAGAVCLTGTIFWGVVVRRVEPVVWAEARAPIG